MGVSIVRRGSEIAIDGRGPESWYAPAGPLDAGNSGSTFRMLPGLSRAAVPVDADGRRLAAAPAMERVAVPLRAMGARIETTEGRPPMTIDGGGLTESSGACRSRAPR
jgi:3-phosphoshikimate 1-carboxyvinyltransferase